MVQSRDVEILGISLATLLLLIRRFFFGWIGVDTKLDAISHNVEQMREEIDHIFERFIELETQHSLLSEIGIRCHPPKTYVESEEENKPE